MNDHTLTWYILHLLFTLLQPTSAPSMDPLSTEPTGSPTSVPSRAPSQTPTTQSPSDDPLTSEPSSKPSSSTKPSSQPSEHPSESAQPSSQPSSNPTSSGVPSLMVRVVYYDHQSKVLLLCVTSHFILPSTYKLFLSLSISITALWFANIKYTTYLSIIGTTFVVYNTFGTAFFSSIITAIKWAYHYHRCTDKSNAYLVTISCTDFKPQCGWFEPTSLKKSKSNAYLVAVKRGKLCRSIKLVFPNMIWYDTNLTLTWYISPFFTSLKADNKPQPITLAESKPSANIFT